ncbi:MAG: bifunctional alpha,alpha-trehalose-phosphate synthase (UDP-forming)/trehalose-phosphatase [Chitinophagaceae bacterium]|nr:bifunctional alpha,alpha-trehalose-phosphate synthase (UDP-forming)/trehalose-phosphatase [Chitinophagaceae bacterium]
MRLVIVSNRLPVYLSTTEKETDRKNIGGLVTGIETFTREIENKNTCFTDFLWVGWPGMFVDSVDQPVVKETLKKRYKYSPVFLSEEVIDGYYNSYCNKVLWPLFHYFSSNIENELNAWEYYKQANTLFYETLINEIQEDDFIWIHDYHLMLLPALIRSRYPNIRISFFLHIPFPAFDMFRQLPNSEQIELLKGMLGADTVGVHANEYKNHLVKCYSEVMHLKEEKGVIDFRKRPIMLQAFPMGINYHEIVAIASSETCKKQKKEYRKQFPGKKIILSVDRLDYTKGIPNRLTAFYDFLVKYPEWREKVILLLIVAPSRREISAYRKIKDDINQLVGKTNGEFGSCTWTPVIYQYRQFNLTDLCVLYGVCDIALVTPMRDGMNLIAKEFIVTNDSKNSVLILSEFAGAAWELSDAIKVNPYSNQDMVQSIYSGLTMDRATKNAKNMAMKKRLAEYDVLKWADDIIKSTIQLSNSNNNIPAKYLDKDILKQLTSEYNKASNCLLFFDYDGTLSPFCAKPELHIPDKSVITLLKKLTDAVGRKVVVISGRSKMELSEWFSGMKIDISAEFGAWLKFNNNWEITHATSSDWKKSIKKKILQYSTMVPESYLEEKEFTLIWDHRLALPETKDHLIAAFMEEFKKTSHSDESISILNGKNSLIVRNEGMDKGTAAKRWLDRGSFDFILAIGDDDSDEELFKILPENAISLRVGSEKTSAKYYVETQEEVIDFLNVLVLI